jgi:DNA-binding response OmpR family regulator
MARVLIVDDEEVARISLAEILRLEGYTIKAVGSGQAAVDTLRSATFDVMILDLKMPGMSGMDVLRTLVDTLQELKIIVLTAHGSMDSAIQALRFRVHDYLLKPVLPEQIVESIESALLSKKNEQEGKDGAGGHGRYFSLPGGSILDFNKRTITWKEGNLSLTPTEARLMTVLVESLGLLITHSELVLSCQGYKVDNEEAAKILRPVVSRLRQKMAVLPAWDEWIKNVRGAGYVLELPTGQG